jgi:hypothetical protein
MCAAISQSGETRDVFKAVCKADAAGLPVFSVVNAVGSLIARTTKLGAPYRPPARPSIRPSVHLSIRPSVRPSSRQAVSVATFLSTVTDLTESCARTTRSHHTRTHRCLSQCREGERSRQYQSIHKPGHRTGANHTMVSTAARRRLSGLYRIRCVLVHVRPSLS